MKRIRKEEEEAKSGAGVDNQLAISPRQGDVGIARKHRGQGSWGNEFPGHRDDRLKFSISPSLRLDTV